MMKGGVIHILSNSTPLITVTPSSIQILCSTSCWSALRLMPNTSSFTSWSYLCAPGLKINTQSHNHVLQGSFPTHHKNKSCILVFSTIHQKISSQYIRSCYQSHNVSCIFMLFICFIPVYNGCFIVCDLLFFTIITQLTYLCF